jgi:TRAP-type C4-dicarboxylate transport system substrate-binding protein
MKCHALALITALAITLTGAGHADAQQYTLKIATVAPKDTPWESLLQLYKRNVEKASNGAIKVKVYLGGNMGDENSTVRMTARGRLQGVGASTGAVASLVPELNALEVPFMFRSAKEADYVLDKKLTIPMEKLFRDRGLVLGFWSENGFRHFGSRFGKIKKPKDLKNRKMRSQESYVHLAMWRALKASPQAIPTTEVLTALKTKAVDGFDQALLFAIATSWHKSITDLTLSGHIYQPAVIAFNEEWFDGLPADMQKILIDEGRKITRRGRKAIRKINPELVKIIAKDGVKIHKLSKSERSAFEKATRGVRGKFRSKQGADGNRILDLVEQGVAEYRKKYGG